MEIDISPIGFIRNNTVKHEKHDWYNTQSEIIVNEELNNLLDGIENFSHISVLFWLHEISEEERRIQKVHPRRDNTLPLLGVFATHTPTRPNPIGLTTVRLLKRNKNVLTVTGLDAINGTPVLDIKSFIPQFESSNEVKTPPWVSSHERGR